MKVIVIGAGLAGCAAAYRLAEKGCDVQILERSHDICNLASGNHVATVLPYLVREKNKLSIFYAAAFTHALRFLNEIEERSGLTLFQRTAGIHLPSANKFIKIRELIKEGRFFNPHVKVIGSAEASCLSGIEFKEDVIFYPEAGVVSPYKVSRTLIDIYVGKISLQFNLEVERIDRDGNGFLVLGKGGQRFQADQIVICNAFECSSLIQNGTLRVEAVRGQTITLKPNKISENLKTIISFDGYITPTWDGAHMLGATYTHNDFDKEVRLSDQLRMLGILNKWLPQYELKQSDIQSSRVSFRTSTHDRMPYIGRLRGKADEGIYVSVGHGSRGMLSCPIGADLLANLIVNRSSGSLGEIRDLANPERQGMLFVPSRS